MRKKRLHFKSGLAMLALAPFLWLNPPANAQSVATQDNKTVQDNDINREELAHFDQFLDSHREIAEQLRKDPSLVDNREFVKNHPELQTYLQDHPAIRKEIKEHPDSFMRAEARFDRREDATNRDRDANRGGDRDVNRQELANFDHFLDSHREISEQLHKDPSLVDNREFVKNHPVLQTYLQDHPAVREEYKENPNGFMQAENRYDRREDATNRDRDANRGGDRDVNRQELANFDHFLDSHHEISEQLHKDPSLVDNREFVKNHPALQTYLQDHPAVREEYKENPNGFMQAENRYDRREDDRDAFHKQFGEFLGGHSNIAQQLNQDPSLVKNQEYLENHPELQEYLKAHPDVQQKLMENPQSFVKSAQQFNTNNNGKSVKPPEPKPNK